MTHIYPIYFAKKVILAHKQAQYLHTLLCSFHAISHTDLNIYRASWLLTTTQRLVLCIWVVSSWLGRRGGGYRRMNGTLLPSTRLFVIIFPSLVVLLSPQRRVQHQSLLIQGKHKQFTHQWVWILPLCIWDRSANSTKLKGLGNLELYFDSKGFIHQSFIA